jgi:uncharacterized protein
MLIPIQHAKNNLQLCCMTRQNMLLVRFGLAAQLQQSLVDAIKLADKTSAYLEATQLAGFSIDEGRKIFGQPKGLNGFPSLLEPLPTRAAVEEYLSVFANLVSLA